MNALVKKVKSCRYSKAPGQPRRDEPFHNTRHACDHPVMKVNWKLEHCGHCRYYEATPKVEPAHAAKS